MKIKHLIFGSILSLLAFTTPAFAEDDNAPVAPNSGQSGIQNPEGRQNGESGEFNHRVDERHEGSGEIIQFISVGGALIVAALLAYQAGKRTRKKRDSEAK